MKRILFTPKCSKIHYSSIHAVRRYHSNIYSKHQKLPSQVSIHIIHSRNITYNEKLSSRGIIDSNYGSGFSDAGGLDSFGKFSDMEQFMIDHVPDFITTIVPELQDLSLSNCWPTVIIAHTFNNVQEVTGLPWYSTIILISILMKTSLYPFHIWWRKDFQDNVKSSPIQITTFLQTYFNYILKVGTEEAIKLAYTARTSKCKELGLSLFPSLTPLYATTLIPLMTALGLAYLTNLTYAPLLSGGIFWFQNLVEPDPYIILPAINSFLIIANARLHPFGLLLPKPIFILGFKGQVAFGILTLSQAWFSSAVLLYWISANSVGLIIQLLLCNNAVRNYHKLENKMELFEPLLYHSPAFGLIGQDVEDKRRQFLELNKADRQLLPKENDM